MITFSTKVIDNGSWQDRYYNFINKLRNPYLFKWFNDKESKIRKFRNSSVLKMYIQFPYEYDESERIILDNRNLPLPVTDNSVCDWGERMFDCPEIYFNVEDKRYVICTGKTYKLRAYLVLFYNSFGENTSAKYMTYLPQIGWFSVDEFEKEKKSDTSNFAKYKTMKIRVCSRWRCFCSKVSEIYIKTIKKAIQKTYSFLHMLDSSYLCIKYPFLYTRNRFNDRHYINHKIMSVAEKYKTENSINANVYIPKDETKIPQFVLGSKSPEIFTRVVQDKLNPTVDHCKNLQYYIVKDNVEYTVVEKTWNNRLSYYPVRVGSELTIYNLDRKTWISLNNQKYNEFSFMNNDDSETINRNYNIITDKFLYNIGKYIEFVHNKIISPIFFIPWTSELDAMDPGWKRAFGIEMLDEIKEELKKNGLLKKHRITQIKEKFGGLRYYCNYGTEKLLYDIIPKYEEISMKTCIDCGRPARYITSGYILPLCEDCINPDKIESAHDLLNPKKADEDEHEETDNGVHI